MKEKAGDFILDLAKLIFGGIIIGGIIEDNVNRWLLYGLGMFVCAFAIALGFALLDNIKKEE